MRVRVCDINTYIYRLLIHACMYVYVYMYMYVCVKFCTVYCTTGTVYKLQ